MIIHLQGINLASAGTSSGAQGHVMDVDTDDDSSQPPPTPPLSTVSFETVCTANRVATTNRDLLETDDAEDGEVGLVLGLCGQGNLDTILAVAVLSDPPFAARNAVKYFKLRFKFP